MPFLFVGLILALMIVANKKPTAAAGATAVAALRRRTSDPIYDIGEEVMVPRYNDWGVIEEARPMNGTWVYGVSISHGARVRVRESEICED